MTVATGYRISLPGADASKVNGINANAATKAVINTGTNLSNEPRMIILSPKVSPSCCTKCM